MAKNRWQHIVSDYLTFSAKERNGILIFLVVVAGVVIGARYYPVPETPDDVGSFQRELAQLTIIVDSSPAFSNHGQNEDDYIPARFSPAEPAEVRGELFVFDPNTLDEAGWKRLGLRERTVKTILNFVAKGYRFKTAEDIEKIYGLKPAEAARLMPYIRISPENNKGPATTVTRANESFNHLPAAPTRLMVDINTADTTELIKLPGIGSKLASRIVNFRQKLGGFTSVTQLSETYGLPDSTYILIKPQLKQGLFEVKKININKAESDELKLHPYIRWNIANAIVNYRKQHGDYKSVEDIRHITLITDDVFNKIAPYLTL